MTLWPSFTYCRIAQGLLSPAQCAAMIERRSEFPRGDGVIAGVRDCGIWWAPTSAFPEVFARLHDVAQQLNPGLDTSAPLQGAAQLTQYAAGQHHDWHMDLGAGPMSLRKLSVVVELAQAEAGGGLEIFYGDKRDNRLPLGIGDAVVFPSFIMHRAVPVTRGTRFSLVWWLLGPAPLR
jgi:hypothetical protein